MQLMPSIFVGHGSPMNIIEDNAFVRGWKQMAAEMPKPEAILAVSAHWFTAGTRIMNNEKPKTIYDFYGFPGELYKITYPAPGAPELAKRAQALLGSSVLLDGNWGLDHGTWCVLREMYPNADIPVFQISVNRLMPGKEHFAFGQKLKTLRSEGVMIFGSGDVVHNLNMVDFTLKDGYEWAYEFDNKIMECIIDRDMESVVGYEKLGQAAKLAVPMPDHFYPLLYVLGAVEAADRLQIYNQSCVMGSLSMTSYLFC